MGSIQESFNQVIGSAGALKKMVADVALTAATGGAGAGALIKDIAGDGAGKAAKAAKPMTEYQKASLAAKNEKLNLDKQKLNLQKQAEARKDRSADISERKVAAAEAKNEINAEKEERLREDLFDKQQRTSGLVAQREAEAEYKKAQAGMVKAQSAALKEKTAGQALKRKKSEYAFKQQKANDKAGQEAIGNYMSNVEALNGQKIGMKQRREMLQNAQQIQLEI